MIAGFDWWLLILGLAIGGGLTWFVLGEFRRMDDDVAADEGAREANWIAEELGAGHVVDEAVVDRILALHRAYLRREPPRLGDLDDDAWYEANGLPNGEASGG